MSDRLPGSSSVTRANPEGVAPPVGRYSHVAIVPPGHTTVYVSGQVGTDAGGVLAGPDAVSQTRQAFANIAAILLEIGAAPADLVKLLTLVAGVDHLDGFRAARDEVFAAWYPDGDVPAHSLAVVTALAVPELVVEIEGVVAIPDGRRGGS